VALTSPVSPCYLASGYAMVDRSFRFVAAFNPDEFPAADRFYARTIDTRRGRA